MKNQYGRPRDLTFNSCNNCQATEMPLKMFDGQMLCKPCTDFKIRMKIGRKMKAYDDTEMDKFNEMLSRLDG